MNIYLGDIRSKTSLLETARVLRQMADGFENQAKILEQKRNYYGIGKHDITPLARAIKFIKSSPEFPFYSASDCHKICDRFALDYLPAAEVLMKTQTKRRLEILKKRNQAIRKMKLNGKKNKYLAKRFDLSETRISEIVRAAAP